MSLFREFKIKWWDKFNQTICSDTAVTEFITTGKRLQYQIQQVPKKADSPATPKKIPTKIQEDSDSEDEFQQFLKFQKFRKMQKQLNRSRASSTTSSSSDPIGGQDPYDM